MGGIVCYLVFLLYTKKLTPNNYSAMNGLEALIISFFR